MRYLIYMLLTLSLVACEKEIPFEGELNEQKTVLNCYLGAGESIIYAEVSRSETVLSDEPFTFVSDAVIKLYDGSNFVGTFNSVGEGKYTLNHEVEAGKSYSIECTDPLLGVVRASTEVPNYVSFNLENIDLVLGEFGGNIKVDVQFNDGASEDDYYHLLVYTNVDGFPSVLSFETSEEFLRNTEELSANTFFYFDDCMFDDNSFNSGVVDISISTFIMPQVENKVQLVHVSSDYFNYRKSLKLALNANGNPFAQPVQIYSNIEGGLGVFAGYAAAEEVLE